MRLDPGRVREPTFVDAPATGPAVHPDSPFPRTPAAPRARAARNVVAAVVGFLVVVELVVPDEHAANLVYLAGLLGACTIALTGVRRWPKAERWRVRLIAWSVALSAGADVILHVASDRNGGVEPESSAADLVWTLSYLLLVAGVVTLHRRARYRRPGGGALDLAAATTVGLILVWQLSISATLADQTTPLVLRLAWVALPLVDALLLGLLVHHLLTCRRVTTNAVFFTLGVAFLLLADLLYLAPDDGGVASRLLHTAWLLSGLFLALGCWPPKRPPLDLAPDDEDDEGRVAQRLVLVALVPLIVPGALEVWSYTRGEDPNPVPLFLATLVLLALLLLRVRRIIRTDRELRRELRSSERYHRALSANSSDAVLLVDGDGDFLDDDPAPALVGLMGPWPGEGHSSSPLQWVTEGHQERAADLLDQARARPGEVAVAELRLAVPGAPAWVEARVVDLLHDPDVAAVVVNLHDISSRKEAEAELDHQAFHDLTTGLANRALLEDRLGHLIERVHRTGGAASVVHVGLEGFDPIRETLGHAAQDQLICVVADLLRTAARRGDTVARLGDDEITILAEGGDGDRDAAIGIAEQVQRALRAPISLWGQSAKVVPHIGIALAGRADTATSLLRDAAVAMHQARSKGTAPWVVYDDAMGTAAIERVRIEHDLNLAIDGGQLRLHHQPVIELATERIIGFEALVRWQHPQLGLLAPDRFIGVAETTGTIIPLGAWVLHEACAAAVGWRAEHPDGELSVAVNVSARQLADAPLVETVWSALERTGLPACALILEITESALVEDADAAARVLEQLRELGVRIAIDDFGTGYSSLGYLRELPIDVLKIDRSFVDGLGPDGGATAIVAGMVELARGLGMDVVAEGIEHAGQLQALREVGCPHGQGYFFGRPMDPSDAHELVRHAALGDVDLTTRSR
jgi:diguanylate cyclase (GGDEF)-like protein/PAS domain S-box-containing protein